MDKVETAKRQREQIEKLIKLDQILLNERDKQQFQLLKAQLASAIRTGQALQRLQEESKVQESVTFLENAQKDFDQHRANLAVSDKQEEANGFFDSVKQHIANIAAEEKTATDATDARDKKALAAPTLVTVGVSPDVLTAIECTLPQKVTLVTLRDAQHAFDFIALTATPTSDYRPHAFRVLTTRELCTPLRRELRARTLTPTLDCTFFDPDDGGDAEADELQLSFDEFTEKCSFK